MMASSSVNRIVLAGNPGVGKSALLNTIIGHVVFRSGVSLGTGMTRALDSKTVGDWMYSDTPGLDDVETREKAAEEISSALKIGGNIKLIFVMTLEAGRVRGVDMATMVQILDAIEEAKIDVNYNFSVLVNKVSKQVLRKMEGTNKIEKLFSQINVKYRVGHADYLEFHSDAHDADDCVLDQRGQLLRFLEASPFISIQEGSKIEIRAEQYENTLQALTAKMRELEQEKEKRDKIIAELREQMAKKGRRKFWKRLGIAAAGAGAGAACTVQ